MARRGLSRQDIDQIGANALLLATATENWGREQRDVEETVQQWANYGIALARADRLLMWETADWWNRGERYGERVAIVTDPNWTGPSYQTCRNYGVVAKVFPPYRRRYTLSFAVHAELAAALTEEEAHSRILQIEHRSEEAGEPITREDVRQLLKRERRVEREASLAEATAAASQALGSKLYGVILADPPWDFEVYSRESGMDRSAENHYPCMDLESIQALQPPAARDCVLFLWRTMPMCAKAVRLMESWGFEYKSEWIWGKDRAGTGYWGRCQHEVLMIGTRGNPVAPSPGLQPNSLLLLPAGKHSEKPEAYYDIIEGMFPHTAKIEMFARGPRAGWDFFGNDPRLSGRKAA